MARLIKKKVITFFLKRRDDDLTHVPQLCFVRDFAAQATWLQKSIQFCTTCMNAVLVLLLCAELQYYKLL